MLKKQYAEILKSIDNMLNAIQSGIITSSTKERLEELEQQKIELTVQISQEEMERPMLTKEQIIDWLKSLKKYGNKRLDHKRKLINIFVNSVYLYDDKIIINFNYKDGSKAVRTDEVKKFVSSSDLHVLGGP